MQTSKSIQPDEVRALIQAAPASHILRLSNDEYRDAFITAFLAVYGNINASDARKILKRKFLVSADSNFLENTYLQGASELSVANYIRKKTTTFSTDKRINPENKKDVDVFCKFGTRQISVEVKCAENETNPDGNAFVMRTHGRIPDHQKEYEKMRTSFGEMNKTIELGKNKDNTLKQFLVEAHDKFNPNSGVDDLNVLFVACGDLPDMNNWYGYLHGNQGLFTSDPFHPSKEYCNVDVVILSNLKYRHEQIRNAGDWSLTDTFVLPFVNPHWRSSALAETITRGLGLFEHHLPAFAKFSPRTDDPRVPQFVLDMTKVLHFIGEVLSKTDRVRYFPTLPKNWPPTQ